MVIVLVVLTILAFVLAEMVISRRAQRLAGEGALAVGEAAPSSSPLGRQMEKPPAAVFPEGYHYHPGHTWARATEGDLVAVGLDELAGKVVGKIEGVKLPKVGESVRQGQAAWVITRGGRKVELVSPVTGVVAEVNSALERDPQLINRSPYAEGWAFKTRMERVKEDLKGLYAGAQARKFMDLAKAWVCFSFSPADTYLQLTYQDGGELVEGIGDRLDDEAWEKLRKGIFLTS